MIISLKGFDDIGKCSMGTLLEEFDTEKNHIYLTIKDIGSFSELSDSFVEVKIRSVNDLCKFLWCNPFISTGNSDGEKLYYFSSKPTEWWYNEWDELIEKYKADIAKYEKKFMKEKDDKKKEKIASKLSYYRNNLQETEKHLAYYDEKKKELVQKIIEENQ